MEERATKFDSFYKTNFSKDIVLKNKETIFLRIENRIQSKFPTDPFNNLWVTLVPYVQGNQFQVNMIDAKDLMENVDSNMKFESDAFNLMGTQDPNKFNGFMYPDKSLWRKIDINGKTDFRIDYSGSSNDILKLTFLFSTIDPADFSNDLPKFNPGSPKPGDVIDSPSFGIYVDPINYVAADVERLKSGVKAIHEKNYSSFDQALFFNTGFKFDYKEVYITGYSSHENDFKRNYGNWLEYPMSDNEIVNDKTSFGLMRTNPKLSGNIKLTVDKNQDLWLDTIDANDALSDSKLKRFKVDSSSSFPSDVSNFLSNGNIPSNILFDLYENDKSYENTKRELAEQHDLFYGYGVQQVKNEFYEEDLAFLAPIWLKSELPEYFVIFKVDHPISLDSYAEKSKEEIVNTILSNAELIKTYDMRMGSKLGTYVRNLTNNTRFIEQPLFVNYEKDAETTWTGIDYKKGVLTSKTEYIFDTITVDSPIKEFEEFITNGFERNNLICSNILNLNFLFDDETSDYYEINRYLGFYVNTIELAKFGLDKDAFDEIPDQVKVEEKTKGDEYNLKPFLQQNENGIVLPVKENTIVGKLPLKEHIDDKTRFITIQDRNNLLKRVVDVEEFNGFTGLRLKDTVMDISNFLGITNLSHQVHSNYLKEGHSQMYISVMGEIVEGESFRISMNDNKINVAWEIEANSNGLEEANHWKHPVYDVSENTDKTTFSPDGTNEQIADSIANAFNVFDNRMFHAYARNNNVYFVSKNRESHTNFFKFERTLNTGSMVDAVNFYNIVPEFLFSHKVNSNSCQLTYSMDESRISKVYSRYTVHVSDFQWGSPGNDLMVMEVYRSDGSMAFNEIVKIGETFLIDDFLTLKSTYSSQDGMLDIVFTDIHTEHFFVGGCDTPKNRVMIKLEDTLNLTDKDWFQVQFEKFDKLLEFDVNGEKFYHLPYLDEPIVENGIVTGFNGLDEFGIIQTETPEMQFYLNFDLELVSFNVYETSLSVLSFLNIKDFDFDFIKSDYAYSPLIELDSYFGDAENGIEILENEEYNLNIFNFYKKTDGVKLKLLGLLNDDWEEVLNLDENQALFNTFTPNTLYNLGDVGSPGTRYERSMNFNKTYSKFKIKVVSGNGRLINFSFQQDKGLNEFKGFSVLRDFWYINDEQVMQKLIQEEKFERFMYKMLFTEYDKLAENYRTEFAKISKVVPFINKWVHEGTDARDNKYRLNVSSAFGYTNFSPDYNDSNRNPHSLTHEWNYIDRIPKNYSQDTVENVKSYFFESLNTPININGSDKTWYELFREKDKDWFTKYFTIGYPTESYEGKNVIKGKEERFTTINYDEILDESFGFFRGAKFSLIETDGKGNKVKFSRLYDGYKFAAIMSSSNNGPKISTEIIDNRKFKTFLIITKINFNDYKFENDLNFVSMYTSNSSKRDIQAFDMSIDTVTLSKDDTSLDGKNYIENQIQRNFENNRGAVVLDYADVELLSKIDVSSYERTNKVVNYNPDYDVTFKVDTTELDKLGLEIHSEIKPVYSQLNLSFFSNSDYMFATEDGEYYQLDPMYFEKYNISSFSSFKDKWPMAGAYDNKPLTGIRGKSDTSKTYLDGKTLTLIDKKNTHYTYAILGKTIHPLSEVEMSFPLSINYNGSSTFYLNGGSKILGIYLNQLTFSKLIARVEDGKTIEHLTIDDVNEDIRKFNINFIETDKILKTNVEHVELDTDKPVEYMNVDTVGFVGVDSGEKEVLYRHRGKFEPKTKNILDFWVRESDSFTDHYEVDFLGANTKFLSNFKTFGTILNKFSNKVADSEVMKVSRTSNYRSLYPLVNETTMYAKDYFTFLSNWDHNYYDKFTSVNEITMVDGTNDLTEEKSFFGSKAMKIPKVFEFYTFNNDEVNYTIQHAKYGKEIKHITRTTEKKIKDLSSILEIVSLKSDKNNPKWQIKKTDGKVKMNVSLDYFENIVGQPIKLKSTPVEQTQEMMRIEADFGTRLMRDMIENGASLEFDWMKDESIPDFVNLTNDEVKIKTEEYILMNILRLFEIDDIRMYSKPSKGNDTTLLTNLTKEEITEQGYIEEKGMVVHNKEDLTVHLEKVLDSKKFKSFVISVSIKRI